MTHGAMKRWLKKVEKLGARMTLRELSHPNEWLCLLVHADTPAEPILFPYVARGRALFRDDAVRAALAAWDPEFPSYAALYAHHAGGRRHPW